MSNSTPLSAAKAKLLHVLKTKGAQSSAALADRLKVTPMAVRQHLAALEKVRLVEHEDERGKVGRPTRIWRLADTPEAQARFPDSHAELTLDLLKAAQRAFGADGMERLVVERTRLQAAAYRREIPSDATLDERVAVLARIRSSEGYLAESSRDGDAVLLVENHCPICAAATYCPGLCRGELELFREILPDASIERTEHVLAGERRCVYRIEAARGGA